MNAPVELDPIYVLQRDLERATRRADERSSKYKNLRTRIRKLETMVTELRAAVIQPGRWNGESFEPTCCCCGHSARWAIEIVHADRCPGGDGVLR